MKILGISEIDNDAGAALLVDGQIVRAANEERFSRIKRHPGFPYRTIDWILKEIGIGLDEIDKVAIAKWDDAREIRLFTSALHRYFRRKSGGGFFRNTLDRLIWSARNVPRHRRTVRELNTQIREWVADNHIPQDRVVRVRHHPAHAACAYYFSGFSDALLVTMDGQGMALTATVSIGRNDRIQETHRVHLPHSLGLFYAMVTKACGFKPNQHEGKITGLAAYGSEQAELKSFVDGLISHQQGTIVTNNLYGAYLQAMRLYKKYGREDISYAYQKRLEEVVVSYISYHWERNGRMKRVGLAGGVFANVRLNQKIKEALNAETFVFPHMADGGLCVGAAAMLEPKMYVQRLKHVYLGPQSSVAQIRSALEASGMSFIEPENLTGKIVDLLIEGKTVARYDGRTEFGPRALGNRSILYHTQDPSVNDWLNRKLRRNEFMPFAPVTLREYAGECYQHLHGGEYTAEFMTICFDCTEKMKRVSPAVVHLDGTARPQIIDREINPGYYDILREYHQRTQIPSLINTSFNIHEEPIVCTPEDAIRAFQQSRLDALGIGPFLVQGSSD